MTAIEQLYNNLSNLINNWDSITDDFLHRFDADFIDLNQAQMLDGEQADGDIIGELSKLNADYKQLKISRGSKAARKGLMDFHFEGDFFNGISINDSFNFESSDSKTAKLLGIAPNVLGVQDKRLDEFSNDQILPEFIDFALLQLMQGI